MPRGPKGEKRPADVVSNAVHVMRIATGEIPERLPSGRAIGGKAGAKARTQKLSPGARKAIAKKAAAKRWGG